MKIDRSVGRYLKKLGIYGLVIHIGNKFRVSYRYRSTFLLLAFLVLIAKLGAK